MGDTPGLEPATVTKGVFLLPGNPGVTTWQGVMDERSGWEGPVDRATMLVNRKVRNRQFRERVLNIYGSRCALTGMNLMKGGGRAETQAAHIMSVEAGGPTRSTTASRFPVRCIGCSIAG